MWWCATTEISHAPLRKGKRNKRGVIITTLFKIILQSNNGNGAGQLQVVLL